MTMNYESPTIRLSHDDILARHQKHLIIIIINDDSADSVICPCTNTANMIMLNFVMCSFQQQLTDMTFLQHVNRSKIVLLSVWQKQPMDNVALSLRLTCLISSYHTRTAVFTCVYCSHRYCS